MGDAELKSENPGCERESKEVIPRDLYTEWPGGRMTVHLDVFFPASMAEIRKLVKIIGLDIRHRDKHIRHMLVYLKGMTRRCKMDMVIAAGEYVNCREKYLEFQERARSKRHPDGIPLTAGELKEARTSRDFYRRELSVQDRAYKQRVRYLERIDKNRELIRKLTGKDEK